MAVSGSSQLHIPDGVKTSSVKHKLKSVVVLEVILAVVVEALEMRCLSFFIWVFFYCRNIFSLLLKMVFCRLGKVGSSSNCCRDILMLAVSVSRWLILILVHLILLWIDDELFITHCTNGISIMNPFTSNTHKGMQRN